jgi:hypothetical protein
MENPSSDDAAHQFSSYGTVLEAAFVDPAYTWPPPDGEGKNAIELQASVGLLEDTDSVRTTDSQRQRMVMPEKPNDLQETKTTWGWRCCRNNDAAILDLQDYGVAKKKALQARKEHYAGKKARAKLHRQKTRYNRVPEGILIYRLDTSTQTLSLMSEPHSQTNLDGLVAEMVVASAKPSPDKTRRGMLLQGVDGQAVSLVACEQRTAIAWLETVDIMLANKDRLGTNVSKTEVERRNVHVRCIMLIVSPFRSCR